MTKRSVPYILLGAFCVLLFFWQLGTVPLIGFDEGCYAECSREMLASGNYVVPTCNGEPFFDKPPITYWLQAASMRAFGVNSFAARLPSAVESLALIALTVFLGTRLFSRRTGLMAGFALATSTLATGLARLAIIDALFGLTITASLGAFALAYLGLAKRQFYLAFWAALGLSIMVKGPAGAVLILGTIFVFLLMRRDLGAVRRMMPLGGIALCAAIALPWYAVVNSCTNGAFLNEFIIHQNFQRALGKDFSHNAPFYYYLPVMLAGFFPWSAFLPAACYSQKSARKTEEMARVFLVVWIGTIFVVFSALKSKLPGYIFPIYPAAALIVAHLWSNAMDSKKDATLKRSALASALTACALGAIMLIVPPYLREPIEGVSTALIPMAISLIAGCTAAYIMLLTKKTAGAFAALCTGMAVFLLACVSLGLPIAARQYAIPAMKTGSAISEIKSPIFAYKLSPPQPQIAFYAKRPVLQAKKLPNVSCILITQANHKEHVSAKSTLRQQIGPYLLWDYIPH